MTDITDQDRRSAREWATTMEKHGAVSPPIRAAAAPDLANTIAGMRWEYRIEEWSGYYWYPCEEWTTDASLYEGYISRDGEQLVRRLVGPVEVVEG